MKEPLLPVPLSAEMAGTIIAAFTPFPGEDPLEGYCRALDLDVDAAQLEAWIALGRTERARLAADPAAVADPRLARHAAVADTYDRWLDRNGDLILAGLYDLAEMGNPEARGLLCARYGCSWEEIHATVQAAIGEGP